VSTQPLAISVGDPAGVGPEVAVRAVAVRERDAVVLFGDGAWLRDRALEVGVDPRRLVSVQSGGPLPHQDGVVGLAHVSDWPADVVLSRRATAAGGRVQLLALDAAVRATREGRAAAIVTGPVSKFAVASTGVPFVGQTEHLARAAALGDDEVTMMFLGPRLRLALVTTHLPVRDVPARLGVPAVVRAALHLREALVRLSRSTTGAPIRLVISGLNPHAGEDGLFGIEEHDVIEPAVAVLRGRAPFASGEATVRGPLPAEMALRLAVAGDADGVVLMMHDQATIASKLVDWGQAVNVTWGLPFVRTSVDHGVAYDAAARQTVDPSGMIAALEMARTLSPGGGE